MPVITPSEESSLLRVAGRLTEAEPVSLTIRYPDEVLTESIAASLRSFRFAAERGIVNWFLMFSGGKDSTASAILAIEAMRAGVVSPEQFHVVYADTGVEIPPLKAAAEDLLGQVEAAAAKYSLPVEVHRVKADVDESYWVCLLGKGYPPPHQKFRWCTDRLKIRPADRLVRRFAGKSPSVVVTGVRFGESRSRDRLLRSSCERGGECGQGVWFQQSKRSRASFLAPLVCWSTCEVWDFLNFVAPDWGWKTDALSRVYGGQETRFGCWTCTVVHQDRAMESLIRRGEWEHLRPLAALRSMIWELTRGAKSRILRPDGVPGKLSLRTRRQLLVAVQDAERKLGSRLVSDEELQAVYELWSRGGGGSKERRRRSVS